jgi:septal ring factor EnvC (AmiA/AmiB activator)
MTDATDPSLYLKFISELGGWGALVLFCAAGLYLAWKGGMSFMALAREFSTNVVEKLEAIRGEMAAHNQRLEELDQRMETVDRSLLDHTQKLERLTERLTHVCQGSKAS